MRTVRSRELKAKLSEVLREVSEQVQQLTMSQVRGSIASISCNSRDRARILTYRR
jgi:hypothetical protein